MSKQAEVLRGVASLQRAFLHWAAWQDAAMVDRGWKDHEDLPVNDARAEPGPRPRLRRKRTRTGGVQQVPDIEGELSFGAMPADWSSTDTMGHHLTVAPVLNASGRPQGSAVVVCSVCGAYAWGSARDLSRYCPGRSARVGARKVRLQRYMTGRFPKHGELLVGTRRPLTPMVPAWLRQRWAAQPSDFKHPPARVAQAGGDMVQAGLAGTIGLPAEVLARIGSEEFRTTGGSPHSGSSSEEDW